MTSSWCGKATGLGVLLVASVIGSANALGATAASTTLTPLVPDGWKYQPRQANSAIGSSPGHIGTLREVKTPSELLTVPVIVEEKPSLKGRSPTLQLQRLEADIKNRMKTEKKKPSFFAKKILDNRPFVEAEYGVPGKGFTWVHASLQGNRVVTLIAVPRELRPSSDARDEFFKMARALSFHDE